MRMGEKRYGNLSNDSFLKVVRNLVESRLLNLMNEKSKMPKSLVEEMDDVLTFKHLDIDSFDK